MKGEKFMSAHIPVKNVIGWEQPITVQWGYTDTDGEFIVDECNHAGATVQTHYNEYPNLSGQDLTSIDELEVCDKCPAWRPVYSDTDDDYFYGEVSWQYDY